MYFIELFFKNAKQNKCGKFEIKSRNGSIPKWTILSSESSQHELLRLITLSTASPRFTAHLDYSLDRLMDITTIPLHLEFVIFHHPETEGCSIYQHLCVGSGLEIFKDGASNHLGQDECECLSTIGNYRKIRHSNNPAKHFLLAYGPRFVPHEGTDDFDFTDPCYPLTRFHTLFRPNQKSTDPVAFLRRLQHKGIKYKKRASLSIMTAFSHMLKTHLGIDTTAFLEPFSDLERTWRQLYSWQRRMILPAIDIIRHVYDAFPKVPNPLDVPGVIILHRPDIFCTDKWFSSWIRFVDSLLPNMQFIVSLSDKTEHHFPTIVKPKRLMLQDSDIKAPQRRRRSRLPKKPVLLIDVDGKLPNLALMKLSRYYKEKGKDVVLARKRTHLSRVDKIFASCIFNSKTSMTQVQALKKYYGSDIKIGGSGVDLILRLPEKIEAMPADYDLYPELKDRAIGFITRGCPHKCPFCVVPIKEGTPRRVSTLSSLLGKKRKKLILLDDNLLAHEQACAVLEEMASMNLEVNFTQTLDFRHLNQEKAKLLRSIDCMNTRFSRTNYYFSLNNNKRFSLISRKYKLLGFTARDNVEFICMYGFDTTLAQDVERFRFLRSLPGAFVFMQEYQPVRIDVPPRDDISFFDDDADDLLDELIAIVFTQNMKSMEKYYRWVSRKYALTFGRLHDGLVDTIFRYNNRHKRGQYIATLAGTRNW